MRCILCIQIYVANNKTQKNNAVYIFYLIVLKIAPESLAFDLYLTSSNVYQTN